MTLPYLDSRTLFLDYFLEAHLDLITSFAFGKGLSCVFFTTSLLVSQITTFGLLDLFWLFL